MPAPTARYASANCACAVCIVASSPPSTQISTSRIKRGNVVGSAADELVEGCGGRCPVVGRNGSGGRELDALVPRVAVHFGNRAPKSDERIASRRVGRENLLQHLRGFGNAPAAQLHFGQGPQEVWIFRINPRGFDQQPQRVGVLAFLLQAGCDELELLDGQLRFSQLHARPRPRDAGFNIGAIEIAEPCAHLGLAALVPASLAALCQRQKIRTRVDQQALARGEAAEFPHGVFVVGLDLENFPIERDGLRKKALAGEMVGDLAVLVDRLLHLP